MESFWRPALILGVVAVLIVGNVLEFRARRRREAAERSARPGDGSRREWLAEQRQATLCNIEQLMHLVVTLLVALLVAVLTA